MEAFPPIDEIESAEDAESLGREYSPEEKQELIDIMSAQAQEWEEHLLELEQKLRDLKEDAEKNAIEIARLQGEIHIARDEMEGLRAYVEAASHKEVYGRPPNSGSKE